MENKKIKYLIALAGLFHDIGKFYQRATGERTSKEEKDEFGHAHAVLSNKAIKEELNIGLTAVFSPEEINYILEGTYHHNPKNSIQHLLQKADWVSSSERDKAEAEYILDMEELKGEVKQLSEKNPRLRSIFERIELDKKPEKKGFVYKITPLQLGESIFPVYLEEVYNEIAGYYEKVEKLLGDYKTHWEAFKEEFNQKLESSGLRFGESPEKVFSTIYHLLYKYLWCIPASTYDWENYSSHYPDISLFDHSRVLSAVACCFYDYDKDGFQQKSLKQFKEETQDKDIFLHIKGDISGIQAFIYRVYEGKGGVAKTLRGRSFYVAMLPEVLARYILGELGYPISNLLYSGGGVFEILLANTEENGEKLKDIEDRINEFLARKFEADLGLVIGKHQYSPKDIMDEYRDVLVGLNEDLDNRKKQKFLQLIETGKIFDLLNEKSRNISHKEKCPVCQTYLIEKGEEFCEVCEEFRNIGQKLPQTETLVFMKGKVEGLTDKEFIVDFEDFGIVYLLTKDNYTDLPDLYKSDLTTEVLDINKTKLDIYITGFKFIGNTVPRLTEDLPPEESGEEELLKEGQIAPFTELAKYSDGDKRIGILRMDVDNLGKLFSKGLGKNISISRIANLSRSLDLFFAGYLNEITKNLTDRHKDKIQDLKVDNLFYILYSGGDDLFLVAPWDKAVEIAQEINDKFDKYTCQNPNITISAGYFQTKPKFPIRVSAEISGEAEKKAKDKGRNRICIMGDVLEWDRLEKVKKDAEILTEKIRNKDLQRGLIYAIHQLKEQFLRDNEKKEKLIFPYRDNPNTMFYPYVHYYIVRNINNQELRTEIAKLLLTDNLKNLKWLNFLINYVALKTRN